MRISDFIKAKRAELALTQPQMALQAGVGLRFLRELERGKPSVQLDKVNQVLKIFGVEVGVVAVAGSAQESQLLNVVESASAQNEPASKAKSSRETAQRPNVLVLCGRNKKRSRTAEAIFKNDTRFEIRSAGLSAKSDRKVSESDLRWANLVLIMEHKQRGKLHSQFPGVEFPPVVVLQIGDEYAFMDPELTNVLTEKINLQLRLLFNI